MAKRETPLKDAEFMLALGQVIQATRKAPPMINQDDFADLVGIYRSHMGKIETGKLDLRVSTLQAVARGLKMPLSELIKLAEERLEATEQSKPEAGDQSLAGKRSGA